MANLNDRVCIIGGGPAGISAAMYLQKKGYENYEIYEKLNKVGGKSYSPKIEVNGEERSYETGAIMGAITYHAVHEVEEFGGTTHADGPNMRRMYRDSSGKEIFPFDPKKDFSVKKTLDLLKLKSQMKKLVEIMNTKYTGYDCYGHRGVAQGKYSGLDKSVDNALNHIEGVNPNLKDLALPFDKFCKLNGVEEVMKIWIGPYTSFGYGYFDEIPAAYVMKYLDTTTAIEFINMRLWTWKEGTQSIYVNANKKLLHPAHLNTEVVKVERPAEGEEGKIRVTIRDAEGERVEEFDKLIVTTPLDYFAKYADAREDEKELFSKIIHEKYVNFISKFDEDAGPTISGYIFDNMTYDRLGHAMVYYHRWEDLGANCPSVVYALRNHLGSEDVTYDYTIDTMMKDMELCGFPVKERLYEQETYYCPHVSSEDYANGWYDKLEAMQGKQNTYYGGEIISFGDMEDTCAASKDLVVRFF
ncbi:MAG: FAD-dependent oxidoreductase [Erysipelotrichaceae bacterium]|nr:FAD-dependent oxidoreductase [Erysipelotrichaceae bacterium]